MNLIPFLLYACLASWWSETLGEDWWNERKVEGIDTCHIENGHLEDKTCFNDGSGSGFITWNCVNTPKSDKYNVWEKTRVHRCANKEDACMCWEDLFGFIICQCVDARKPPSFPPTGVIRWNGTYHYDDEEYSDYKPTTTPKSGEIHKDSNGRFLHIWTEFSGKRRDQKNVKFEIIIPVGKTFLRYKGNVGSKKCTRDVVNSEKDLNAVWRKEEFGKRYTIKDTKPKSERVDNEVWYIFADYDGSGEEWFWTVEYDKTKGYAIPKKYLNELYDMGIVVIEKREFTYTPLEENDESFRLDTYCDV